MKKTILTLLIIIPNMTFAAGVTDLIDAASDIVSTVLIPLAFALALLYFFWGMVKYIRTGAGSEEATKEGKKIMVWGIVGLFIVSSIWGIITFIRSELGIPDIKNVSSGPLKEAVDWNINYKSAD